MGCTNGWGGMTCTEGLFDGWRISGNQHSRPFDLQFSEKLHDFVEWLQLHLKFPDFAIFLSSLFHVQGREAGTQREEGNSPNSVELSMSCGPSLNLPGQSKAAFAGWHFLSPLSFHLGKTNLPALCQDPKERTEVCFEEFRCLYLPKWGKIDFLQPVSYQLLSQMNTEDKNIPVPLQPSSSSPFPTALATEAAVWLPKL